jgi:hypothetical protein
MGFSDSFFRARANKRAEQRHKLEQKIRQLQLEQATEVLGNTVDRATSRRNLLTPDSSPTVRTPEGPPRPEEQGITARLAQGQTDTIRDALQSGLLDEIGKLQAVQQGETPFTTEGKEAADLANLRLEQGGFPGQESQELRDLEKRLETSGTAAAKPGDINALRGQYIRESRDNFTALSSFEKISALSQDPSGAGDIGMIFAFMKQLDPGSRVTEGETALASQVSGAASQFLNLYNRLVKGERLTDVARQDILFQAGKLAQTTVADQKANDVSFGGVATRSLMDPRNVAIFQDRLGRIEGTLGDLKRPDRSLGQTVKAAEESLEAIKEFVNGRPEQATPIDQMSPEELATVNLDSLSPEDRAKAEARINQLLQGTQ